MDWLKVVFIDSWPAIIKQPFPFLVMLVLGFMAAKYFYAEKVEVFTERIKERDEELSRKDAAIAELLKSNIRHTGHTSLKGRASELAINLIELQHGKTPSFKAHDIPTAKAAPARLRPMGEQPQKVDTGSMASPGQFCKLTDDQATIYFRLVEDLSRELARRGLPTEDIERLKQSNLATPEDVSLTIGALTKLVASLPNEPT
jgi:hypothetical protein